MKYQEGNIVVLNTGETVYITVVDKKSKIYKGFNAEENNPENEIRFSESEVIMKI